MPFSTIPEALDALRTGECIVMVDDENRENEEDLICAAQFTTSRQVNFMASIAALSPWQSLRDHANPRHNWLCPDGRHLALEA